MGVPNERTKAQIGAIVFIAASVTLIARCTLV